METIGRDVVDLSPTQRDALEGVVGHPMRDDQRIVVQLVDRKLRESTLAPAAPDDATVTDKRKDAIGTLPGWCAVFADLSDEEFAEIESAILRRSNLSRTFELRE